MLRNPGTDELAPDTFHEFEIPANLFDENGVLTIAFANPNNTWLLFPLDDGLEVLYREGGFGLNYARGLGDYFLLDGAAGGESAWRRRVSYSFPVAAFFSLSLLKVALVEQRASNVVEGRKHCSLQFGDGKARDVGRWIL